MKSKLKRNREGEFRFSLANTSKIWLNKNKEVFRLEEKRISVPYRIIKGAVRFFYPKMEVVGVENLPEEAVIVVGNHAQMNGPIVGELYYPGKAYTWCAGEMMEMKEVPAYAYRDFWSGKPKWIRWFYKILAYVIPPLCVCVFNNANTIPVYHDTRVVSTFRQTLEKLREGTSVIIFPEHDVPRNHILCEFQDRFIDIAKMYHRQTGKEISFVPMYIAPALKKAYIGKAVVFSSDEPEQEEKQRVKEYLMSGITEMAVALPKHRVTPYTNMPKKNYPYNK